MELGGKVMRKGRGKASLDAAWDWKSGENCQAVHDRLLPSRTICRSTRVIIGLNANGCNEKQCRRR